MCLVGNVSECRPTPREWRDRRDVLYFIWIPQVRPERFELPTFWFVAVVARRINKLHQVRWSATDCHKCNQCRPLSHPSLFLVAIGRVWWWAQKWAHFHSIGAL